MKVPEDIVWRSSEHRVLYEVTLYKVRSPGARPARGPGQPWPPCPRRCRRTCQRPPAAPAAAATQDNVYYLCIIYTRNVTSIESKTLFLIILIWAFFSSSVKPSIFLFALTMIFICFSIVDLPLSPEQSHYTSETRVRWISNGVSVLYWGMLIDM